MLTKTNLNWLSFSEKFQSWKTVLRPGFERGLLDAVFSHLKKRNREVEVFPASDKLWRPFQACPLHKLNLVIAVDGPYLNKRADGLALSSGIEPHETPYIIPEPLESFYNALEVEIYNGLCLECMFQGGLNHLAHQGVLLLNTPLTGDAAVGPHRDLWQPFLEFLFAEVLSEVPVLFLGEHAGEYAPLLAPWQHQWQLPYPTRSWKTGGVLQQVDQLLKGQNINLEWMEKLPF